MNTTNLVTVAEFKKLRKGTVLVSITGTVVRKGYDTISMDIRNGYLAYNVVRKTVKELRAGAKSIGMTGYSRLRKHELVAAIVAFVPTAKKPARKKPARKKATKPEAPREGWAKSEAYAKSIGWKEVDLCEPIICDDGEVRYFGGMSNGKVLWR